MAVASAITAGASLLGAGLALDSAARNRRAGRRAADQEREATAERVRRLRLDRDQVLGAQVAGAAAGGVDVASGSVRALQAETVAEFDRQISFTERAGAFAADAANVQSRNAAYQNLSAGLNSLSNAVRIIDEAGGLRATFGLG